METLDTLALKISELEKKLINDITNIKEATTLVLALVEKASCKAEVSTDKRFDAVNEFCNVLRDQQSTFLTKNESDFRFKSIELRVDTLVSIATEAKGKSSGITSVGAIIVVVVNILISLAMIVVVFVKS